MAITRKSLADELQRRLTNGPSFDMTFLFPDTDIQLTEEQQAKLEAHLVERYKNWSQAWVLSPLKRLVKELQ